MWVFTETGFVSAIMHFKDKNIIVVRSRERESLDGIAALADVEIVSTPKNDYRGECMCRGRSSRSGSQQRQKICRTPTSRTVCTTRAVKSSTQPSAKCGASCTQ